VKFCTLAMAGAAAAVLAAGASAATCTGFGKYSAPRAISGEVRERERDALGFTHIVVKDEQSGCRVFVLTENKPGCVVGRQFAGYGRLRSDFKGSEYDSTLDAGRSGKHCL
jgi:hypothetical protein